MALISWVLKVKIISKWRQYYRQLDNVCYSYRMIRVEVLQKLAVILQIKLVCAKFTEAQQLEKIVVVILTNRTILDIFLKTVQKIFFTCYNCLNLFPSFLLFPLISLPSLFLLCTFPFPFFQNFCLWNFRRQIIMDFKKNIYIGLYTGF